MLCEDGVGSVVFAHKTTEGWEALLSGMIRGGWTITGSWPIATEMGSRLRARDSAALATSMSTSFAVPRPDDAPIGDWADVLRELPERVGDWMERLQEEGIRGADLVFACVGPALEIFSRYRAVETAEGREVGLADYLEKVWEVVGRAALGQVLGTAEARARNGLAGALEEDARLTALFLWTFQSTEAPATSSEADDEDEEDAAKAAAKDLAFPSTWCAVSPSPWASTLIAGPVASSASTRALCACCRWPNAPRPCSVRTARRTPQIGSRGTRTLACNGRCSRSSTPRRIGPDAGAAARSSSMAAPNSRRPTPPHSTACTRQCCSSPAATRARSVP